MTEESSAVTPVFQDKVLLLLCRMIWCDIAADWAKAVRPGVETLFWDPGEPWPSTLDTWQGDWLISFRGDLIVPEEVYRRARKGSLNFHPAPPRYRGSAASSTPSTTATPNSAPPATTSLPRWTPVRSSGWTRSRSRRGRRRPRCATASARTR